MILLVDDEEIVRMITTELLKYLGYEVHVCSNGPDAIDYYKQHFKDIDLIILDMVMPGMRGNAVFQHLKEIYRETRVLFLSGYSHDHEVEEIMNEGAMGYLRKPVSLDELARKIELVLSH